jgi:4-amino-4-deoxy-L-arabinose transferase-like glycosyltransferase
MTRPYIIAFVLCFFGLAALQPVIYHSVELAPDEGYFMFLGNGILHGAVPYLNYVDIKPPGIAYTLSLAFLVLGKSMYVARGILYITHALSALVLFLIGKELWNKKIGAISSLLFLIGILMPAYEGYYVLTEPFLTLFSLLGFLFFIKGQARKPYLIASGAAIGIATIFKQTGPLLLIAVVIFYLCNLWIPANRNRNYLISSTKNVLLLLCGFLIPLLAMASYYWRVGMLEQLIYYSILILKGYGSQFSGIIIVGYQFASFSIIFILSLVALLAAGYKFIRKSSDQEILVAIWMLVSLVPLVSRQYGHYFIQIFPPVCLLASLSLVDIFPGLLRVKEIFRQHDAIRLLALVCAASFVVLSISAGLYGRFILLGNSGLHLQYQKQTAEYIRSHTTDNDTIVVYPYQPAIYFFADRDPCVKLLVLEPPEIYENQEQDLLQQIMSNNPKYAVIEKKDDGETRPGFTSVYQFLMSHFRKEKSIGIFDIYRNDGS